MKALSMGETPAVRTPAPRRGQKIALGVFAVVVLADGAWIVARYGTFNPDNGRAPLDESLWFFPMLMVHIVCSSIALLTCVGQLWPWLRAQHPRVHRTSGQLYVLVGVEHAEPPDPHRLLSWNPIAGFSDTVSSVLLLVVTTRRPTVAVTREADLRAPRAREAKEWTL